MKCPNCGFESPPEMRYCGMCGTPLTRPCSICNSPNPLTYRYCGMCGALMSTQALDASLTSAATSSVNAATANGKSQPEEAIPTSLTGQIEGERRAVTVLMTDLSGSTNLLEQVGNESWVESMNQVLHLLEGEVLRYGGHVEQFRGDGMVAFFGENYANEDDPERAVLAALSMQEVMGEFSAKLQAQRNGYELKLRVGINTGEVIITPGGESRQRHEETAMGVGVTVAARMEVAAEPGTILVSDNTYRLIEAQFDWLPLGEINVKGLTRPVSVYRPLSMRIQPDKLRGLEVFGVNQELIGREKEFSMLKKSIEDLKNGRSCITLLSGEAGVGKTFLLSELTHYFELQDSLMKETPDLQASQPAPLTWLKGSCRSYGKSWPYSMWLDLLYNWLGVRPGEGKEELNYRLRDKAGELWGEQADEAYPYLATFLSLPLEESYIERVRHLDAESLRQQFYLTLRRWVEALAEQGPVAISFTEMHWADNASLDLLKYCLSLSDKIAIAWICVFRPERDSGIWEFRHHVETHYPHRMILLELSPFTTGQSKEFIDSLVGPASLPAEIRDMIVKNAEGNPYYILELIHSMIDQGVLVQDCEQGKWCLQKSIISLDLPDTLNRLLQSRIDRLTLGERNILQLASVIGKTFWANLLHSLVGETNSIVEHLTALQRAGMIVQRSRVPELGIEYSFKSTLIHDVAYESLLSTQRLACHLKVAEFFENEVGFENREQYDALIAFHYRQAGKPNRELFYTLRAAEQAREVYANSDALGHYNRVLALLGELEAVAVNEYQRYAIRSQRFEALTSRLEIYYSMGDVADGDNDARSLLPLAQSMDDDLAWTIDALLLQPQVHFVRKREEIDEGLGMAMQALEYSRKIGDQNRVMQSLMSAGQLYRLLRDRRWEDLGTQALALARQLGDQMTEVNLLLSMGEAYGIDDLERSGEYLEAALPISQKMNDKRTELRLLRALGDQSERRGDYYRLLEDYEKKRVQIAHEIGDRLREGFAQMYVAQVQGIYLGDYENALPLFQQALRMTESLTSRIYPLLRLIQLQTIMGKYDEALQNLERAIPIGELEVEELGRAGLALVSAILYNLLGDEAHLKMALELCERSRQMVREQKISRQYEMAACCQAAVAQLGLSCMGMDEKQRQAHVEAALEYSQVAYEIYREFGFTQIIECVGEEVLFRHSRALSANGRVQEAAEFVRLAYQEMVRKAELIPANSPFRRTFLEEIDLHREIRAAWTGLG